jgi:glycosyltransferase involved in cell wall biosynthesis
MTSADKHANADEIAHLEAQLAERDAQIARLQLDLDTASATLAEIYTSKGWRVLVLWRWIRRQQIRIFSIFKTALLLLTAPRDLLSLVKSAWNVLRREGWAGVISSARFYINYLVDSDHQVDDNNLLYNYLRAGRKSLPAQVSGPVETFTPRVSVIVPNYNHSAYLEERLRSIYEQTYQNFEVILLDDCSTDDSRTFLQKYADRYADRTRCYFNAINSGSPFSQWEKGISLAEGDLIWIAESDDFCDKNFLETLVPYFLNDSILLSYAQPVFVNEEGKRHAFAFGNYVGQIDTRKWNTSYIETAHREVNTAMGLLNTIPNVSGVLFRRLDPKFSLFNDPNWKKMRVCGDWLFYLHLIRGGALAYSRSTHNYYRIYASSTSKQTHTRDVYYEEHEQVAIAIASLYKISDDLLPKLQARLREFYLKNVEGGSRDHFNALFDLDRVNRYKHSRLPNVLMGTYALAFGGGEIFPVRLANALYEAGAAVTLFNGGYEPTHVGVRKMLAPQISIVTNHDGFPVNEMLDKFGIEIIHTHHASMENYFSVKRRLGSVGIKHVATMHGMYEMMDDFMRNTRAIRQSVEYWVYTADKNITPFTRYGLFKPEKFKKIENGLPAPRVRKMDLHALGIDSGAFAICLASRALADKGWFEAIDAIKMVRERTQIDVHLLLIGEGPVYDLLKNESLPDFIHLLGYISNLDDYIAACQLGLLPTYFKGESFPLILIQFFMAGLPVVATDHAEIERMVKVDGDQAGAVLVKLKNSKVDSIDLADAVIKMVTDREFYDRYSTGARQLKNRFDINNIARHYLEIYQNVMGSKVYLT